MTCWWPKTHTVKVRPVINEHKHTLTQPRGVILCVCVCPLSPDQSHLTPLWSQWASTAPGPDWAQPCLCWPHCSIHHLALCTAHLSAVTPETHETLDVHTCDGPRSLWFDWFKHIQLSKHTTQVKIYTLQNNLDDFWVFKLSNETLIYDDY